MFWIAILCSAVTVGSNFLVGHFSVILLLILWSVIWSVSYLTNPLLTLPHHHLIFDSTFCKLKHALPFRISRKTNRWISKPYHFTTTCLYYYYTLPKFPTQSPRNYSIIRFSLIYFWHTCLCLQSPYFNTMDHFELKRQMHSTGSFYT